MKNHSKQQDSKLKKLLVVYGVYKLIKCSILILAGISAAALVLYDRIDYRMKAPKIIPCEVTVPAGTTVSVSELAHYERTENIWLADYYWLDGGVDWNTGFSNDLQSITFGDDKTGTAVVRVAASGRTAGHEEADIVVHVVDET